jgi:hypothetical protein
MIQGVLKCIFKGKFVKIIFTRFFTFVSILAVLEVEARDPLAIPPDTHFRYDHSVFS